MSLTVFPTIVFDSSGSDTAASGAGPTTALSGSAGNVASGSTTATITDAVNLSGVATDGSAVLWISTASGRQFSRISAISGSSGAWTLTLEDSVWTTSTNVSWGIGGKRLSADNTNSRKLFSDDVKGGWTIQINSNQTLASALLCLQSAGSTTTGPVVLTGNSDNPRPILTQTINTAVIQGGTGTGGRWVIKNLSLQNNLIGSKSFSYGIKVAGLFTLCVQNCVIGDATNTLQSGINTSASGFVSTVIDSEVKNCLSDGISAAGGAPASVTIDGCNIHGNGGNGVNITTIFSSVTIQNCTIYGNTSDGIVLANNVTVPSITENVIDGNGGNGINLGSNVHSQLVIYNNNITGNTLYGVTTTVTAQDACKAFVDYNCFGNGSSTDGPANTSGAYNGITAGTHDKIGVSPNYAGRGSSPPNFTNSATSNVKAKGFPDATRTIGGNTGGTVAHDDIGVQHQDASSSSSVILSRIFGGF